MYDKANSMVKSRVAGERCGEGRQGVAGEGKSGM